MFIQKDFTLIESVPALVLFILTATLATAFIVWWSEVKHLGLIMTIFLIMMTLSILTYWLGREKLHSKKIWSEEYRRSIPRSYGMTFNCLCSGLWELPRFLLRACVSCFR